MKGKGQQRYRNAAENHEQGNNFGQYRNRNYDQYQRIQQEQNFGQHQNRNYGRYQGMQQEQNFGLRQNMGQHQRGWHPQIGITRQMLMGVVETVMERFQQVRMNQGNRWGC